LAGFVAMYNAPTGVWEGSVMLLVAVATGTMKASPVELCDNVTLCGDVELRDDVASSDDVVGPALGLVRVVEFRRAVVAFRRKVVPVRVVGLSVPETERGGETLCAMGTGAGEAWTSEKEKE
jgi:hypothetical protein